MWGEIYTGSDEKLGGVDKLILGSWSPFDDEESMRQVVMDAYRMSVNQGSWYPYGQQGWGGDAALLADCILGLGPFIVGSGRAEETFAWRSIRYSLVHVLATLDERVELLDRRQHAILGGLKPDAAWLRPFFTEDEWRVIGHRGTHDKLWRSAAEAVLDNHRDRRDLLRPLLLLWLFGEEGPEVTESV